MSHTVSKRPFVTKLGKICHSISGDENDQLEEVEPLGEEMDPLGEELDPLSEEAIDALNPLEKLDKYFQSDAMLER